MGTLTKSEVKNMRFEIDKSQNNQYFFRIVASNGKILAHSETYYNLNDCENAVQLIRNGASSSLVRHVYKSTSIYD